MKAYIVLRTKDIEASREFYECLGLDFLPEQHGNGPTHYSANFAGLVLEIYQRKESGERATNLITIGIPVRSVSECLKQFPIGAEQHTNTIRRKDGFVELLDPDGYTVHIFDQ